MRSYRPVPFVLTRDAINDALDADDLPPVTANMVHVSDGSAFTGLYNEHGTPLYREKEPFGFRVRG